MKENNRKSVFCVYIVQCRYGTYYTGSSNDLKNRIRLHNCGKGAKYLRGKGPVKLVYSKKCQSQQDSLKLEIMIKHLTRGQKMQLINGYGSIS